MNLKYKLHMIKKETVIVLFLSVAFAISCTRENGVGGDVLTNTSWRNKRAFTIDGEKKKKKEYIDISVILFKTGTSGMFNWERKSSDGWTYHSKQTFAYTMNDKQGTITFIENNGTRGRVSTFNILNDSILTLYNFLYHDNDPLIFHRIK